jgi:hypothetical protein
MTLFFTIRWPLRAVASLCVVLIGFSVSAKAEDVFRLMLEEPIDGEIHGGVGNLRGWAVASEGIEKVEIFIDGEYAFDAPYGGARGDVGGAFPEVPNANQSGFSSAYAYSLLSSGTHTIAALAHTTVGTTKESAATFEVVKFKQAFINDPDAVDLTGTSCSVSTDDISVGNAQVEGDAYDVTLNWRTAEQGFEIVQIEQRVPVAPVVSPAAPAVFLDDEVLRVFAASDVSAAVVEQITQDTQDAHTLWMGRDYYGKNQAKAIYLMITGADSEAATLANRANFDPQRDVGFPSAAWCREDTYIQYVGNGGAGINSSGPVDGFYFYAHGAKEDRADRIMSFHEVFHVYQMTNIFSDDYEEVDAKMGRRTADDPSADVAWWSEGNADFWSALYGTDFAYFERAMRNALEGNGPFAVPRKTQYFNDGAKLYNISWSQGDTVDLAYRIGSWFVAYLVMEQGEDKVYQFWETVDQDGFAQTFSQVFGKDYKRYVTDFEAWLQKPNSELLQILENLYSSKRL